MSHTFQKLAVYSYCSPDHLLLLHFPFALQVADYQAFFDENVTAFVNTAKAIKGAEPLVGVLFCINCCFVPVL